MNDTEQKGGASWAPGVLIAIVLVLGLLVVGYVLLEKGGSGSKGILEDLLGFRKVIDDGDGSDGEGSVDDEAGDSVSDGDGDSDGDSGGQCSGEPDQSRTDGLYGCGALGQAQCETVSDETVCTWGVVPGCTGTCEETCYSPTGESSGSSLCDAINDVEDVQSACQNAGCMFNE